MCDPQVPCLEGRDSARFHSQGPGICLHLDLCSTVMPAAREKLELETKAAAAGWRSLSLSLSCSMSSSFHPPDPLLCLSLLSPLCCELCSLPLPARGCSPPSKGLVTSCRASPVPLRPEGLCSPSPQERTCSYIFPSESPSRGLNPAGMGKPCPHCWRSCPPVTKAHLGYLPADVVRSPALT